MTWTSENWKQDDSVFYGYPIPMDCSAPVPFDRQNVRTFWKFTNQFYGYPIVSFPPVPFNKYEVRTFWKFDNAFYGYPHVMKLEIPVYVPHFTRFSMSGLGAGFRQQDSQKNLDIPDSTAYSFSFKISEKMHFHFNPWGVIKL